jgi:Na+/H+ antiporter NhaC
MALVIPNQLTTINNGGNPMISTVFIVIFATTFGGLVLAINALHDNPFRLTLRGRRVLFAVSIIAGLLMYFFVSHFNVDCDLRSNANTPCVIGWFK